MSQAIQIDDTTDDLEKLAVHREALERLAESSLPIAEDCQRALTHLEEHNDGGSE